MTKQQVSVSVVVPTRNSARTIEACLKSVRAQKYRPLELIVIDNASSDGTSEIARRYANLFETHGPERSAQRNRGARISSGTYLLFIDADMTLAPTVVEECVDIALSTGAPGIVIPETTLGYGFVAQCRAFERSFYVGDDSVEAARFFSRTAFEEVTGFDEALTGPEDWDLTARVSRGRSLPRISSYISHDEGRLTLSEDLGKKKYYGASFLRYWRKRGRSSIGQGNLVFRPAFLRNWRQFARHPVLGAGVLSLKSLESAAAMWGVAEVMIRSRRERGPRVRSQ